MPSFPKPKFQFRYDPSNEITALRRQRERRAVPASSAKNLLVATWNIANFGAQQRRDEDHRLIAEIVSWFDIVALQEVRENHAGLEDIVHLLGNDWSYVMSDVAGNNERMVFVYRSKRVRLLEEIGEIAYPPAMLKRVSLPGVKQAFIAFDRNPYLATFAAGRTSYQLVNVHLYFGGTDTESLDRRALETYAVAYWSDARRRSKHRSARNIVALGDFNMPAAQPGDAIFEALTKKGLALPGHSSKISSSIASDAQYDQVAFFQEDTAKLFTGRIGVFDFDAAIFADLWRSRPARDFRAYCRYYISDHRPMWLEFRRE